MRSLCCVLCTSIPPFQLFKPLHQISRNLEWVFVPLEPPNPWAKLHCLVGLRITRCLSTRYSFLVTINSTVYCPPFFVIFSGQTKWWRWFTSPRFEREMSDSFKFFHRPLCTIFNCVLDSTVSGQGPVAGCCECGDEPSGSCATELVCSVLIVYRFITAEKWWFVCCE
jgi:hypothetical protein